MSEMGSLAIGLSSRSTLEAKSCVRRRTPKLSNLILSSRKMGARIKENMMSASPSPGLVPFWGLATNGEPLTMNQAS
eukprot:11334522-Prorocentrum_lima.AAC.1